MRTALDYKKELEAAAKSMILVHEPDILIKMIVRMIVQKVKVRHAGILLHQNDRDTYVLNVSRGALGLKIPAGFARMDADNPLIRFFRQRVDKQLFNHGVVVYEEAKKILKKEIEENARDILKGMLYQMEIFEAEVCIPSYFRNDLLGLLFLGRKNSGKKFAGGELDFFSALASDVAMAIRNAYLFQQLQEELNKEQQLFINTIIALATAIEAKDNYTRNHTANVTNLSLMIAEKIMQKNKKAFDEKSLEQLRIASLLHDIGKIGVPEVILNKPGPLNEEERRKMKEHPAIGVAILQPIKELKSAILGVKYHHEKYDGSGYPDGLKGDEIPIIASIISIADTFDAMITNRPYRSALPKDKVIEEIKQQSGKQFDPQLSSAFIELYQEGKI